MGVRGRGTRSVTDMAEAIPSEPPKLVAEIEKAACLAVLRLMPRANGLSHPTASVLRCLYFTTLLAGALARAARQHQLSPVL